MTAEDPRDAEIATLRQQVTNLSEALARVSQLAAAPPQPSGPNPEQGYKPPGFVMIDKGPNAGQCIRVAILDQDLEYIRQEGFRWDGNTPVFPPHWPRYDMETGQRVTIV